MERAWMEGGAAEVRAQARNPLRAGDGRSLKSPLQPGQTTDTEEVSTGHRRREVVGHTGRLVLRPSNRRELSFSFRFVAFCGSFSSTGRQERETIGPHAFEVRYEGCCRLCVDQEAKQGVSLDVRREGRQGDWRERERKTHRRIISAASLALLTT